MESANKKSGFFKGAQNADIGIAVGLIGIMILFVMPLPPIMIDVFLAISIGGAVVLLLTAVYANKPLDFSVFPSVLLASTLFRLSLNVASTRLVLLNGPVSGAEAAGSIIKSFGEFVVGGNFAVGIVIFAILVIINFIVITKGAGRVAEVAARFTLDAMPGKQMAIDADLNAGVISESDARRRRQEISEEADFYGAMDGASKFVRGDAIAGVLIVIINIVGGIVIGTIQQGMSLSDAASVFILLTVGDGLVSQIPALIISTAAGIIVTRASGESNLGDQIGKQITSNPKAMGVAATALALMALIPGFPKIPFIVMSIALGYGAYFFSKQEKDRVEKVQKEQDEKDAKANEDKIENLLTMDVLELEVGYGLISIVDPDQNGELLTRINQIRKQFATEMGVIIPSIRIRDNLQLNPGQYSIVLKGVAIGGGELMVDHLLAMDPGNVVETVPGVETIEPAFGLPAIWISPNNQDSATFNGYTVVDHATIIATHITELLRKNLAELVGRQELQELLDGGKQFYPKIVEELIPNQLTANVVLRVIQNLLVEEVPIKDLKTILETLSEYSSSTKDPIMLTEAVRTSLKRAISARLSDDNNELHILTLDRQIEETISNSIINTEHGPELSADPDFVQRLLNALNMDVTRALEAFPRAIVLCSPAIRFHLKQLIGRFIPNLIVISHNEISANLDLKSIGTVRLDDAS